ncbi:MAG: phosphotransferase [Runella sp.]
MQLDIQKTDELAEYLAKKGWLTPNESIQSLTKPGEGNMNYTLRVTTSQRTFIIKQARPYVEKYPQIAAPDERAVIEGRFYKKTQYLPSVGGMMPRLLGMDEASKILLLEDLGEASDFTVLYQKDQKLTSTEVEALAQYLVALHQGSYQSQPDAVFANRQMRALNHEHIFNYPFMEENGFDLDHITEGLQMVAMSYKTDTQLKKIINDLGQMYLSDGHFLLHGDYYPGSWLRTSQGVKVIDPEFCFYGPAEFDLGVMTAHLMMAQQEEDTIRQVYQSYGHINNPRLVDQFTGVEIMRRLIGLAQLPLSLSLLDKEELLEQAYELVMK